MVWKKKIRRLINSVRDVIILCNSNFNDINKVLLGHSCGHSFVYGLSVAASVLQLWLCNCTEALWSTKVKIFIIWPFLENVCWPWIIPAVYSQPVTLLHTLKNKQIINIILCLTKGQLTFFFICMLIYQCAIYYF